MQSSRATVPSIDPRQTALTQQSINDDTEGGVIVTNADLNHNNNKKQLENLSGRLIFDAWTMLVSSHKQMSLKMTMSWWRFQCIACSHYNCNNLIHTTWVRTLILHYLYQCWARGHRQGWHHCIVSSHHQVMLPLNKLQHNTVTSKPPQCQKFNFIDDLSMRSPPQCIRLYKLQEKGCCWQYFINCSHCCACGTVFI